MWGLTNIMPDHHFTLVKLLRIIAAALLAVGAFVFYINVKLGIGALVAWALAAFRCRGPLALYLGLSQSPAVKPLVNNAPVSILLKYTGLYLMTAPDVSQLLGMH